MGTKICTHAIACRILQRMNFIYCLNNSKYIEVSISNNLSKNECVTNIWTYTISKKNVKLDFIKCWEETSLKRNGGIFVRLIKYCLAPIWKGSVCKDEYQEF